MPRPALLLACLFVSVVASAATPATFRGRVIEVASPQSKDQHIIFVVSRNGALRKVEVGAAKVIFSHEVLQQERAGSAATALKHGAEVRVLADENGHGLWKARSVEILSLAGTQARQQPRTAPRPEPKLNDAAGPVLSKRS